MSEMIGIKRVVLNERHLRPGRTRHTIADRSGTREFPPFISLMIAQHPGHASCYLMHICEDGGYADTYHGSVGDAGDQAEWEFGVQSDEWTDTNEKRGDRKPGDRERRDKPAHCRGCESPTEKEKRLHSGLESCL